MIWIGCSGWSYRDWGGVIYRRGSSGNLKEYSSFFNTVEVNVTFYRPVDPATINSWIRTVSGSRNFRFSVKAPEEISHRLILMDTGRAIEAMEGFCRKQLSPLQESGYAGMLLIQLPPWFTAVNVPRLLDFLKGADFGGIRVAVEFRDMVLLGSTEIRSAIQDMGHTVVEVDSPDGTFMFDDTGTGTRYYRFHGRNIQAWKGFSQNGSDRYNYDYNKDELTALSQYVRKSMDRGDEIFVYFNNHPAGNAPRNAMEFSEMMGAGGSRRQKPLI